MSSRKHRGCLGRLVRFVLGVVVVALVVCVGVPLGINAYVCGTTAGKIESAQAVEADEAAPVDAVVVLGAGINWDGSPSAILQDRLDVAIDLYRDGAAPKLIMSGDNADSSYNEVMAMANYAMAQGVPARDIFCDHAGVSTYDSMYRLANVFGVDSCVVVTQEYHLYRALYDAQAFGIDVVGVPSDRRAYADKDAYEQREFLARIKDFVGVAVNVEPETKSEPVSLEQSGEVTQWW